MCSSDLLRVASPADGKWTVNEWVKQAILMYFGIQPMQTWTLEPFEFYDKMLLKKNYKELGVRAVPHAVARYGAYLAKNVVLMPSYVNIGAYVDEGTMVDTCRRVAFSVSSWQARLSLVSPASSGTTAGFERW